MLVVNIFADEGVPIHFEDFKDFEVFETDQVFDIFKLVVGQV